MKPIVRLKNVSFERSGRAILKGVTWSVDQGQHWALLGANGSGKTTLLKIITGYEWATRGGVEVLGQHYGETNIPELRKRIGLISAAFEHRIPQFDTAAEIVASGLDATLGLYRELGDREIKQALRALEMVGGEHFARQQYETLSQGEQQRVLIARALVNQPALIILDEPANGLDPAAKEKFLGDLARLALREGAPSIILVTHYIEEIDPWITWVMVLKDGEVLASGRKTEVLTTATLSRAFGMDVLVKRDGARYTIRT